MEDKYYTPKIEEFHVGFEYETLNGFMDGTVKSIERYIQEDLANNWSKYEIKSINDLSYVDRALHGKNADKGLHGIRVKYLDKEDIKSLGYEHLGSLWFENKTNKTRIRKWKGTQIDIYSEWYSDEDNALRFRGSCKNKSEFKKLMEQLNIK